MPTSDKLKEAHYNFGKLEQTRGNSDEFNYEISNFLCSARGVLDYLLEDYRVMFRWFDIERIDHQLFRKQATKTNNQQAFDFIDWYQLKYQELKNNKDYGFLLEKRDVFVHRRNNEAYWMEIVSPEEDMSPHFAETIENEVDNAEEVIDAVTLCKMFLTRITEIVSEAHTNFRVH